MLNSLSRSASLRSMASTIASGSPLWTFNFERLTIPPPVPLRPIYCSAKMELKAGRPRELPLLGRCPTLSGHRVRASTSFVPGRAWDSCREAGSVRLG